MIGAGGPTDGIHNIIDEMRIDLGFQHLVLCFLFQDFLLVNIIDQGIDLSEHIVEMCGQETDLI